jgi:alpha-L-rhamnosidase
VYTLAIVFGLLDDATRARAGDRLAELVRKSGHRISTGFAGTPFITDALTTTGHLDDAYRLLLQRKESSRSSIWAGIVATAETDPAQMLGWDASRPDRTPRTFEDAVLAVCVHLVDLCRIVGVDAAALQLGRRGEDVGTG